MNQNPALSNKPKDSKPNTPPTYANSISVDSGSNPSIQENPMPTYVAMDGSKVTEPDYELDIPIEFLKADAEDDTYDLSICPKYANITKQHTCRVLHKPSPTIKKKPIPVRRTKFNS